jgi:hypothetical protein
MRPTPPVLDVLWMFYDGRFAAVATTMQIWVDADACPGFAPPTSARCS